MAYGFISEDSILSLRNLADKNLVVPEVYDAEGNYKVKPQIRNHRINRSGLTGKKIEDIESSNPYQEFLLEMGKFSEHKGISLLEVQVTEPGQFFEWHADNFGKLNRKLSVLCWLNEGFEGGETEFLTAEGVLGLKGAPGDAVLFDPNIWHRGAVVTSGKKITVLGILNSFI